MCVGVLGGNYQYSLRKSYTIILDKNISTVDIVCLHTHFGGKEETLHTHL